MRGTEHGQEWMTKDECELYEYLGKNIERVCSVQPRGFCRYRRHLRDRKWGFCEKHNILIKIVPPSEFMTVPSKVREDKK